MLNNFGNAGTVAGAGGVDRTAAACASTAGGRTISNTSTGMGLVACPTKAQRVWRDLPRGSK